MRLSFQKLGDRFQHQIAPASTGCTPILLSNEGTADDLWPASPVLQSLHIESRPGGIQAALLVGTAGRSHWSMSVETDPSKNRFVFDIACRIHDSPDWLGSTYSAVNRPAEASAFNYLRLEPQIGDRGISDCKIQINERAGVLQIAPPVSRQIGSQTIRWSYAIGPAIDA
ncbi:MAG TPA: hypothetical protein VGI75_10520 [Pirellulales bacterium]